ncbi:DHA1 family bicyclomycin/chloramphenicol resistance-like MFS transporter [Sinobacterium caligoides]|uniref:Bcr/CflA family efflux transporter n=1 Tax=Sinobacterium caligoides TaxID=933926 RepID=A0A3N2DDQ3_9GAMM|nr:multidrug effflux MFS transporter [Sinobacterium caligoides]ROR97925.1 DHA1 family bicyclomycin/chloramphenicol resistance-like MFS transporter [Sinobacterium caligoides]
MSKSERILLLFILLLIVIGQASIDIYLPSLPSIMRQFAVPVQSAQMTLSAFLLGFGVSQIFYGPLSDRFGRKPILLFGMCLFLVVTLALTQATSVEMFFAMRVLQGVTMGAASVCARAMMRDTFSGDKLLVAASYMAMAWAMVPILAPALGGYIEQYLRWQYSFYLLVGIVAAMLFMLCFIAESNKNKTPSLSLSAVSRSYLMLFKSADFNLNVVILSLLFGVFSIVNIASPIIYQRVFHFTALQYGLTMLVISIGYLLGSYVNKRVVVREKKRAVVSKSILLLLIVSLSYGLFVFYFSGQSLLTMIYIFIIYLLLGFVFANCLSDCLSPFQRNAGSASAMYGFVVFITGFVISYIYAHYFTTSVLTMTLGALTLSLLMFFPNRYLSRQQKSRVTA